VAHELLGTLNPLFRDAGFRIRYVNFGRDAGARPDLKGYAGLVLLGGPMNVADSDRYPHLATEIDLVHQALELGIPVLGICLGAQIIAAALGAEVGPAPKTEIGWHDVSPTSAGRDDPLMRHFASTERIFQWHGDAFGIPEGATHLVTAADCPHQAFRFGERVYGLQFHLEVDEPMIQRWLKIPGLLDEIRALGGAVTAEEILAETPRQIRRTRELARQTFGALIELFDPPRRTRVLSTH
jgi:GMP synthase (glutamine-hydrolysing)